MKNKITLDELANFKRISFLELNKKYNFNDSNGYWNIEDLNESMYEYDLSEDEIEVFYHKGNIHIDDSVMIEGNGNYSYFFIDGDLTIDGTLSICIDGTYNLLGVSGKLNVQNLVLGYDAILFVLDDVTIKNLMFATLADGTCHFAKKAKAKIVISDGIYTDLFHDLYKNINGKVIGMEKMINGYDKLDYDETLELILKNTPLVLDV